MRLTGEARTTRRTRIIPLTYANEEDLQILAGMHKRYNALAAKMQKEVWRQHGATQDLYVMASDPVLTGDYDKFRACTLRNRCNQGRLRDLRRQHPEMAKVGSLNGFRRLANRDKSLLPSPTKYAAAEVVYQTLQSHWAVKKSKSPDKFRAGTLKEPRKESYTYPLVFQALSIKALPDGPETGAIRLSLGNELRKTLGKKYLYIPVETDVLDKPIKWITINGLEHINTSEKVSRNHRKSAQKSKKREKMYVDMHITYDIQVPVIDPELAEIEGLSKKSREEAFLQNGYKVMAADPGEINLLAMADNTGNRGIIFKAEQLMNLLNPPPSKKKKKPKKTEEKPKKKRRKRSRSMSYRISQELNRIAHEIVSEAASRDVDVFVMGHNKGIKETRVDDTGKVTYNPTEAFKAIPHVTLLDKIRDICEVHGILFIEHEEAYTSHTDHLALESMYVGSKEEWRERKRQRISRGMFKTRSDLIKSGRINADWNGALGIARKVFGDSFIETLPQKHLGGIMSLH